ncbi:MAG TPA: hypothetical protein VN770_09650 [Gaiellaceae bacterium]|nr:hypothetical protein [Gaiellaceae bacterium]
MTDVRIGSLDLLLLAAGLGVLVAAGFVASVRDALRLAGLAFVVGFALVGALLSFVLPLGAPMSVGLVLAAAALPVAAAIVVRSRSASTLETRPATRVARAGRIVVGVAAVAVLGYLAVLLRAVHAEGSSNAWDAWTFWIPKAKTIFYFHGLDAGPGGITSYANPEYPPLLPAMDASVFQFAGRAQATLLPVQEWLLAAAFIWGLAGLFWRRVPTTVLAVSLALLLFMPDIGGTVGQSLADLPLSLLLGTAAACLALWLVERSGRYLVPAAFLLAAAAATKKEGLGLAVVLLVATAVAARSPRRSIPLLAPAGAAIAAVVPWDVWLRTNHVVTSGTYRLADVFDPHFLAGRWGRLGTSADRVPQYLFDVGRWELVLPLALLAALLVVRRSPGPALLVIVSTVLGLLGLIGIYWISFLPLEFHLDTSATRTVMPFVVVGGSLLPLLLGLALRSGRAQTAPV